MAPTTISCECKVVESCHDSGSTLEAWVQGRCLSALRLHLNTLPSWRPRHFCSCGPVNAILLQQFLIDEPERDRSAFLVLGAPHAPISCKLSACCSCCSPVEINLMRDGIVAVNLMRDGLCGYCMFWPQPDIPDSHLPSTSGMPL